MTASQIIFYLLSAFMLGAGLLAVTAKKIFRSAVWLLFSLVGVAGLYFWMGVNFIAAVQIIVYVGGIVVLIIFSVFLTRQAGNEMPRPAVSRLFFSVLAVVCGFSFTWLQLRKSGFQQSDSTEIKAGVADIGMQLLSTKQSGYVLPFEVISMLLLAAMIGCIVIAMKTKSN